MTDAAVAATYAQTIVQLYRQLRAREYALADLCRVRDAYALATVLFTTRQQSSGKSFLAHLVGTASILANVGAPAELVAAALLHNAYRNGDFGDGGRGPSGARRTVVRRAVGEGSERYVLRFATLPWRHAFADYHTRLADLPPVDVDVLRLRVADLLEHLLDLGPTLGDEQEQHFVERAPAVATLALALGHASLTDEITRQMVAITSAPVRTGIERAYPRICTPRSFRRRRLLALAEAPGFHWLLPWLQRPATGNG